MYNQVQGNQLGQFMFNTKMENGGNAILFLFIRLKHCNVTPGLKSATLLTTHLKVKPTLFIFKKYL